MNRVINALKAPVHRALIGRFGAAGVFDRAGIWPGLATSCGILRIFPHDFSPRHRPGIIRKSLIINGRTFWPFSPTVRLAASVILLERFHGVSTFPERSNAEHRRTGAADGRHD